MTTPGHVFDSHAHLISGDFERYRPAAALDALPPGLFDDPMTAERLLREMDAAGVARAVLVQRGQVYGYDSSYVCDSAQRYPDRFVAVASVDGRDPDCAAHVKHWVSERGAVGIRMMVPFKGAPISWFSGDTARGVWQAAAELGVPVGIHFFRWNRDEGIPALCQELARYPDVKVVVDHFTNMVSEAGPPDHGADDLVKALACFPQVSLKFTTLPLGPLREAGLDAAPVIRRMADLFGADRLMWGSDITQSKGTYDSMVDLGIDSVRLLNEAERRQVLFGTCNALYGRD